MWLFDGILIIVGHFFSWVFQARKPGKGQLLSFVISLIVAIPFLVNMLIGQAQSDNSSLQYLLGYWTIFSGPILALGGVVLGFTDITQNKRIGIFGTLGIGFNIVILVALIWFWIDIFL